MMTKWQEMQLKRVPEARVPDTITLEEAAVEVRRCHRALVDAQAMAEKKRHELMGAETAVKQAEIACLDAQAALIGTATGGKFPKWDLQPIAKEKAK